MPSRLLTLMRKRGEAATSLLLDTVTGAVAAYSLRKLRTAYSGSCIRVRRSSDNAEQDIGFVSGVLDTASLLTFCGAGNGFIATWYDQSGNSANATQAIAASQPQIVSSGSVLTLNGKPTALFDGTNDTFRPSHTGFSSSSGLNVTAVFASLTNAAKQVFDWRNSGDGNPLLDDQAKVGFSMRMRNNAGTLVSTSTLTYDANQHLGFWNWDGANIQLTLDGSTNTTNPAFTGTLTLNQPNFGGNGATTVAHCNIQEIMFFNNDQAGNQSSIQANINNHYSIY